MKVGYSGKYLAQKLGIKAGYVIGVVDPPENYWELVRPLPDNVSIVNVGNGLLNLVHVFVKEKSVLAIQLEKSRKYILSDGMIWVSWPKKSSKVQTDITEDVVREFALKLGLVDTKVCAVDEVWSGLKLVIRLKNRKWFDK